MRNIMCFYFVACVLMTGCTSVPHTQLSFLPATTSLVADATSVTAPTQNVKESDKLIPSEEIEKNKPKPNSTPLSDETRLKLYNKFITASYLDELRQFDASSQSYLDTLKILPTSTYLSAVAGNALLQCGKIDEAIAVADKAIQNATPSVSVDVYLVLGQAYSIQQKWDKAIQQYENILKIEPDSFQTLVELSLIYLRTNQFDDAIPLFRKMAALDPYQAVYYRFKVATLLVQLNRLDEALTEYQAIAKMAPHLAEVPIQIASIYEAKQEPNKAIEAYETALEVITSPAQEISVRNRLGILYSQQQDSDDAFEQFSRIKKLDPTDLTARKFLISILLSQNKLDEALAEAVELGQKAPGDYRIHLLLREIYIQNNQPKEGYKQFLSAFENAVNTKKKSETNLFLLEVPLPAFLKKIESLDLKDKIPALLDTCKTQFPNLPRVGFALTSYGLSTNSKQITLEGMNTILQSLDTIRSVTEEQKASSLCFELFVWYKVRYAFQDYHLEPNLEESLNRCHSLFPDNIDVLRAISQIQIDQQNWEKAEKTLLEAQKIAKQDSSVAKEILLQLAFVYDKINQVDKLETLLQDAIKQYPNDAQVYNFLGYTYADRNIKLEEAQTLLQKACQLNPNDGNIIDSLGWLYYRQGRFKEAIEQLERASQLERNHPVILDHLGDALLKDGQIEKAISSWKKSLEFGPNFPSEFTPEFQNQVTTKIKKAEMSNQP